MSIVLNSKTYNFRGFLAPNSISSYTETSAGVPAGFSPLTAKVEDGGAKSNTKVRWKLKLPVVQTADSDYYAAGTLLREHIVDIVVTYAPGAIAAERTDVLARITDLVGKTEFTASMTNLVQPSA